VPGNTHQRVLRLLRRMGNRYRSHLRPIPRAQKDSITAKQAPHASQASSECKPHRQNSLAAKTEHCMFERRGGGGGGGGERSRADGSSSLSLMREVGASFEKSLFDSPVPSEGFSRPPPSELAASRNAITIFQVLYRKRSSVVTQRQPIPASFRRNRKFRFSNECSCSRVSAFARKKLSS